MSSIIAQNIKKEFGAPATRVLTDINLQIEEGEFIALSGRSGSGKSTLLYILSTLDKATSGEVLLYGQNVQAFTQKDLHLFRNTKMGFVFQFHYLLPELSALENILMPARKLGLRDERYHYAKKLLQDFGLQNKGNNLPSQMSGGEQQRVAIARALVMQPKILFADEPTGSLDSVNGEIVMNILRDTNLQNGTTVLMVTHDPDFAKMASRQINLVDGKIVI